MIKLCVIFSFVTMAKCDLSDFFPDETKGNLTRITWAHAVNNNTLLQDALKSDVMMLEADVSLGKIDNKPDEVPIMSHGGTQSDLSLEQFLNNVSSHNKQLEMNKKGVKLDFKSIEAFSASEKIITNLTEQANYPIWINADIIVGPGNATTKPVDPDVFLSTSNKFPNATLSIGWTTNYNESLKDKSYNDIQIEEMLTKIDKYNIRQLITFPVRAAFAAESLMLLKNLTDTIPNSTLTIWSSADDHVNFENLEKLIFAIGLDKVYVDIPADQMAKLNLNSSSNRAVNSSIFSVLFSTLIMFATFKLL